MNFFQEISMHEDRAGDREALDTSYLPKVRACHEMIGVLKRTRPQVHNEVVELEGLVARAHQKLEGATSRSEAADSLCCIESAHQMLRDLRHSRG